MEYFYIVVFLVGVFYTLVSLVISGVSGAFHSHGDIGGASIDGHLGDHGHMDSGHVHTDIGAANADAGHAGHMLGGQVDGADFGELKGQHGYTGLDNHGVSHSIISWVAMLFNPLVAVSFLTVFGGMGIMGINYFKWNSIIIFLVAISSGIIISTLLYNFIAKPIYRSENTSDVSRAQLIGTTAEVTSDILANGYGTINYTVNSIRYTAPAKHIDQKAVKQGEKVFICKIEENTFYISEVSSILN